MDIHLKISVVGLALERFAQCYLP